MKYTIYDISRFIINFGHIINKPINNIQLQKFVFLLCYFYKEEFNELLIEENFEIGEYGAFHTGVWNEFRVGYKESIPYQETYKSIEYDEISLLHIEEKKVNKITDLRIINITKMIFKEYYDLEIFEISKITIDFALKERPLTTYDNYEIRMFDLDSDNKVIWKTLYSSKDELEVREQYKEMASEYKNCIFVECFPESKIKEKVLFEKKHNRKLVSITDKITKFKIL